MNKQRLPKDWKEFELGEVCEIYQPKTISAKDLNSNGKYFVFGANGIIGKYDKYNHEKEEVLVTCRGATCGTLNMSKPFSWITGNAMVITPKEENKKEISKRYLFYFLKGSNLKKVISGSAQPQITRQPLIRFKINLPPLQTQKAIVSILEKAEKAKEWRKEADDLTKDFLKSVFLEMFGDREKFKVVKLGDLSSKISSGSTPLGGNKNYLDDGEILFIRSQNVLMNKFSKHDKLYISKEIHGNMKRTWVKNLDVLLNITGASIGRTAVYYGEDDKANVNQHVCIIRVKDFNELNPTYLNYYLSSNIIQRYIEKINTGGTREALNYSQIKDFDLILPPISLQNKFASIVKEIEKIKQHQRKFREEIDNLFNALMQKAFKGELLV